MKKIDIISFDEEGYQPLVSFESWRVAMLNYIDELEPDQIDNVQMHSLTDESFVLLKGRCILYLCDVIDGTIQNIEAIDMEPYKIYNIKKGVYHTHTLSEDAKVLIVENDDTSDDNSPKVDVNESIQQIFVEHRNRLWK